MAEGLRWKTKRSTARTRATKAIRYAEKLLSDNIVPVRLSELQNRWKTTKEAVSAHQEIQDKYYEVLAADGKTEDELEEEREDNAKNHEEVWEEGLDKLEENVAMVRMNLAYMKQIKSAEAWLMESSPTAAAFTSSGQQIETELENLIDELYPYSGHTHFIPLLSKA